MKKLLLFIMYLLIAICPARGGEIALRIEPGRIVPSLKTDILTISAGEFPSIRLSERCLAGNWNPSGVLEQLLAPKKARITASFEEPLAKPGNGLSGFCLRLEGFAAFLSTPALDSSCPQLFGLACGTDRAAAAAMASQPEEQDDSLALDWRTVSEQPDISLMLSVHQKGKISLDYVFSGRWNSRSGLRRMVAFRIGMPVLGLEASVERRLSSEQGISIEVKRDSGQIKANASWKLQKDEPPVHYGKSQKITLTARKTISYAFPSLRIEGESGFGYEIKEDSKTSRASWASLSAITRWGMFKASFDEKKGFEAELNAGIASIRFLERMVKLSLNLKKELNWGEIQIRIDESLRWALNVRILF
ncbi:MAG: hypothetical protein WC117_03795 [Sphaerochaetaceae bacterium]|jgi:hypothetical protein|nr:hypothetical protein [Sphaerochaetaceae bacterium]